MNWNNDSLYVIGNIRKLNPVKISGNFAIWTYNGQLYLKDLQNGTNKLIASFADNIGEVTDNGIVVYTHFTPVSNTRNIVKFISNNYVPITNNDFSKFNVGPLTDCSNIVFIKTDYWKLVANHPCICTTVKLKMK